MVIIEQTNTVADLDEALTNIVATMQKSEDRTKLMQNIDALLDARLGTQ